MIEPRALTGSLGEESLLTILEPLCKSRARALLDVQLAGEEGRYGFRDGMLTHAWARSLEGAEAAYHLVSWRGGTFRLTRDVEPPGENVSIQWDEFLRFYRAEIEKILLGLLPKVNQDLYFDLTNSRGASVVRFTSSPEMGEKFATFAPAYQERMAEIHRRLRDDPREVHERRTDRYVLLVKYLHELQSFAASIFTTGAQPNLYREWLEGVFEPKALEATVRALERSDLRRIRGTILVVDDSPVVVEVLRDTLSGQRFRVETAEDGYEGLVKLHDLDPDLILLDVMMPKLDGYEVLRRVRRDPATREIPVVMLTSKDLTEDGGKAFEGGAQLYIEKPFTEKKIVAVVESVLGLD